MKNVRLYLFRHGLSNANINRIYAGSGTNAELCDEGKLSLSHLKEKFEYPKVDTIFSSPMKRALQTADILYPDCKDKIILNDLTECSFGEFEGKSFDELSDNENFKKWLTPEEHYTPINGESAKDFAARCSDCLMKICEYMLKSNIDTAAVFTHGGVIMNMLMQHALPKRSPDAWQTDPGCGYGVMFSTEMYMRDKAVEAFDIVPFGYLDTDESETQVKDEDDYSEDD